MIDVIHEFSKAFSIPIPTVVLTKNVKTGVRPRKGIILINPNLPKDLFEEVLIHELFHEFVSHKNINFKTIEEEEEWVRSMTKKYLEEIRKFSTNTFLDKIFIIISIILLSIVVWGVAKRRYLTY